MATLLTRPQVTVPRLFSRRRVLHGVVTAAIAASSTSASRGQTPDTLRFGLTPVFLTNDLEILERLQSYLAAVTGRPVQLIQRRTYQEITTLLVSGELDAAWICGYPFLRYRDQLQLLALPVWNGRPLYQSYLIVDADRDATEVDQLRGDIHAFSDPDSNSGYLVTAALLAERKLRPSAFFARFFFTYGHRNVVRAVSSGLAGSGSVDGYVWEVLNETEPELTRRTRIFRKSEWLGFPPIAGPASPRDAAATKLLTGALVEMDNYAEGRRILHMLRLDSFRSHEAAIFDSIAKMVRQVQGLG